VATLIFANAYSRSGNFSEVAAFIAHAERLADGRLRIAVVNGWTSPRDRDEERTVLEDVASGVADLGWTGARAVGAVFGIRSLDPLQAPLLFPDEDAVRRFAAAVPATSLLAPLREAGLAGLTVLGGELRRPFGITAPLVTADDWRGKVIRTHASLPGEASFTALGATPVLRSAAELAGGPPAGIDGMDLDPTAIRNWGYPGWLTWNVPLWPRLLLIAANRRRLERLSSGDRAVLEEAARRTAAETADRLPRTLGERAKELPQPVQLVEASDAELVLLRRRLRPVYDEMRSTGEGERTLALVERLIGTAAHGS
jgi:TRAP-type C4-dicarboxylate transport system substrate-binding protein